MMPENVNEAIPSGSGFLLEKLNKRIVWALQEQTAYWNALVDASLLEGIHDCSISSARTLAIVPRSRDYELPLLKLRHVIPLAQSYRDTCSVERVQYLRFDEPILFYQRSLIHVTTPSGDSKESTMSFPLSPEVSYRQSTLQALTTPQLAASCGLPLMSLSS